MTLKHAQQELKKRSAELKKTETSYKKDKDAHTALVKAVEKIRVRKMFFLNAEEKTGSIFDRLNVCLFLSWITSMGQVSAILSVCLFTLLLYPPRGQRLGICIHNKATCLS